MANEEIFSYIREKKGKGYADVAIRQALKDAGWQDEQVEEAFASVAEGIPMASGDVPTPPSVSFTETPSGIPGVFDLIQGAWDIFTAKAWTLIGIMLLPMAVGFLSIIGLGALGAMLFGLKGFGSLVLIIPGIILICLVISVLYIWGQVALLYAVRSVGPIGVIEAYRTAYPKILSYMWLAPLTSLVVIGGLVLFIIPGIIVAVWIGLSMFVLVAEDDRGMNALLKSKEYVRGRWLPVFGRFAGLMLLVMIVQMIIEAFVKVGGVIGTVFSLVSVGFSLVITPVFTAYAYLIYLRLKELRGAVSPDLSSKGYFWALAMLGIVVIIAIIVFVIVLMMTLGTYGFPPHDIGAFDGMFRPR